MHQIINYFKAARRRRLEIKIAVLEAKIAYWESKTTKDGFPEYLTNDVATMKGTLAGLRVALTQDVTAS